MKFHSRKRSKNKDGRILFALLLPMLFIILTSFGYAQWSNSVTATAILSSGTEEIIIASYNVPYYNGYGIDITIADNQESIAIQDELLFPEWELELVIEIHNPPTVGNLPLYIWSEIQYNGEPITTIELQDLFGIIYTDRGFYLDPALTEIVPDLTTWQLLPGDSWYKVEHLLFDAQDRPELQGQSFAFQVVIYGSFNGGP